VTGLLELQLTIWLLKIFSPDLGNDYYVTVEEPAILLQPQISRFSQFGLKVKESISDTLVCRVIR